MSDTAATPMPLYQCHKKVWALKIKSVQHVGSDNETSVIMHFENEMYAPRQESTVGRPIPQDGWYMIQYEDGYISFSPAEAFESGYSLIQSGVQTEMPDIISGFPYPAR